MVDIFDSNDDHAWANYNVVKREFPEMYIDAVNSTPDCIGPNILEQYFPIKDRKQHKDRLKRWLHKIVAALAHCIKNNELFPGFYAWNEKLVEFLQEFGFNMNFKLWKQLVEMYLTLLVKFPKKDFTTGKFQITVQHDFRAVIVIGQTLLVLLNAPLYVLEKYDLKFELDHELVMSLLSQIEYLKFGSEIRMVLGAEYNTSLHEKAAGIMANVSRNLNHFYSKKTIETLIKTKLLPCIEGSKKLNISMPNYEQCIWYMEITIPAHDFLSTNCYQYFNDVVFPILSKGVEIFDFYYKKYTQISTTFFYGTFIRYTLSWTIEQSTCKISTSIVI